MSKGVKKVLAAHGYDNTSPAETVETIIGRLEG